MIFFFSSRRRHTRWTGDWSSDVCSSDLALSSDTVGGVEQDLLQRAGQVAAPHQSRCSGQRLALEADAHHIADTRQLLRRSEERRVGKEGRSRWWPYQ